MHLKRCWFIWDSRTMKINKNIMNSKKKITQMLKLYFKRATMALFWVNINIIYIFYICR